MSMCDCNQGRLPCSCKPTFNVALQADRAKRVYVAGPMTGIEDFNFPAFHAAADWLRVRGHLVESPAEHGIVEGADWADYMAHDLTRLGLCGTIYLLPGWTRSKGAMIEKGLADALGMQVMFAEGAETGVDESTTYDYRTDLHAYFGLTYASWLTLPRVLLQEMPDPWKRNMALLLHQYDEAFPSQPSYGTTVRVTQDGKIIRTPEWLINYRHPDYAMINQARGVDTSREKE